MFCPCLEDLPKPDIEKKGWPWTQGSEKLPEKMPGGASWPTLTIVTPSYQQGQFLEETIRSVLLQGYPDLEYIIIDGGSTDNSIEIIKKYEKWLTYWESQPDRGQCHAINKGWAKAKPGIWAWLNSDDTYFPGTLPKAILALKNHPQAKLVYATVSHTDENNQHLYYYYGRPLAPGLKRMRFWQGWNIPQPTVFFHSELVERYGGLDENFQLALDYELFIRFSKHVKFKCIDETWATTRIHGQAKTGDWKTNKERFFKENRKANKKNNNFFQYYYLRFQEYLYNKKESNFNKRYSNDLKKGKTRRRPYKWGTVIQFGKYGNAAGYKKGGWRNPELIATLTRGKLAELMIPISNTGSKSIQLKIDLKAFLFKGKVEKQNVKVLVNGNRVCQWTLQEDEFRKMEAVLPKKILEGKYIKIVFELPDAVPPIEIDLNKDQPGPGIYVRALELTLQ